MSDKISWHFKPQDPMGDATGSAYVNPLAGTVKSGEQALAREAVQNSCDAGNGGQVTVKFRIETMTGQQRKDFVKALRLDEGIRPRLGSLGLPRRNCLTDAQGTLSVTYVEDFGTVGLGGNPHHRDSNFYKLLLSLGDPAKATAHKESGGSYGYGKSALLMNSRLHTVVAYSTYKKDEMGTTAKLMGCGYFSPHTHKNEEFGGRAWLGHPVEAAKVEPLYDDEAHALAALLGFSSRNPNKYGTSLLIVDSSVDPKVLLRSIEDWWWPRIVDQEVNIEVHVNGKPDFPKPKARKDLVPFIDCYRMAQGSIEPTGKHQRREEFNRLEKLNLGACGVEILKEDEEKAIQDSNEDWLNSVALVRSPKMVVEYLRCSAKQIPAAVGVYYAHSDVDEILKLAEPPAHDHWAEDSTRLAEAEPDEDTARKVVRQVKVRLKEKLRTLQAQAEPPKDQQPRHLTALEKELGALLKLGIGPTGDREKKDPAPVEIEYDGEPLREKVGKAVRSIATVTISAKPTTASSPVKALMRVKAAVLEDEDASEGERLPVTVTFAKKDTELVEELEEDDGEKVYKVKVAKDRPIAIKLATDTYDTEWVAKFNVTLEDQGAA